MTSDVRDTRLKRLLERGKKKGYILFAELDELLPENAEFETAGVEIVA